MKKKKQKSAFLTLGIFALGLFMGVTISNLMKRGPNMGLGGNKVDNYVLGESAEIALTQEQLNWGETQVRQMLKDRPLMTPMIKEGDNLWTWLVRQFAGSSGNGEIRWDPTDPVPLWNAMSSGPKNGRLAFIQVTKTFADKSYHFGELKTGYYLWGNFFLELFNIRSHGRTMKIEYRAANGELSREAYIVEHFLVEVDSLYDAYRFFQAFWVPHCKKMGIPFEDQTLIETMGEGMKPMYIEDKVNQIFLPGSYHYKFYGEYYDSQKYGILYQRHLKLLKSNG